MSENFVLAFHSSDILGGYPLDRQSAVREPAKVPIHQYFGEELRASCIADS